MYLLIILSILIIFYVVYQTRNKFKGEKRKDILCLQLIIFSLLVLQFISGKLILVIPAMFFIIILAFSPKKFYNWVQKNFKL